MLNNTNYAGAKPSHCALDICQVRDSPNGTEIDCDLTRGQIQTFSSVEQCYRTPETESYLQHESLPEQALLQQSLNDSDKDVHPPDPVHGWSTQHGEDNGVAQPHVYDRQHPSSAQHGLYSSHSHLNHPTMSLPPPTSSSEALRYNHVEVTRYPRIPGDASADFDRRRQSDRTRNRDSDTAASSERFFDNYGVMQSSNSEQSFVPVVATKVQRPQSSIATKSVEYVARLYNSLDRRYGSEPPLVVSSTSPLAFRSTKNTNTTGRIVNDAAYLGIPSIFRVENLYATPTNKKALKKSHGFVLGVNQRVEPSEVESIEVDSHAGTIIYIYSPYIIAAIEKVVDNAPGLIKLGDELVVPEPFCALWFSRDQLLPTENSFSEVETVENQAPSDDQALSIEHPNQTTAMHLRKLYTYLDKHYLVPIQREKERWSERQACTFEWAWLLFAPGTLVYEKKSFNTPTMRAFLVKSFVLNGLFEYDGPKPIVNPQRLENLESGPGGQPLQSIVVIVTYNEHDGRTWLKSATNFTITPFKGEKLITDLAIFPANFQKEDVALKKRLIERGQRYHKLGFRGQFDYDGQSVSGVQRRLKGRIFLDQESFHYEPHTILRRPPFLFDDEDPRDFQPWQWNQLPVHALARAERELEPDDSMSIAGTTGAVSRTVYRRGWARQHGLNGKPDSSRQPASKFGLSRLSDDGYITCTPTIPAYFLKEQEWYLLAVDSISDCKYQDRMIDDLQLEKKACEVAQALSHNFRMYPKSIAENDRNDDRLQTWGSDFVPGKGSGRIILLHGTPGVGKTTTAECIAELTHRPLLNITCGDLGTHTVGLNQELSRWLRLGTLWNAVLLFDEADIFLEARKSGDIERNSLVSVFLRALEYYQGLMFLTTNRIGTFDEAILSRVHAVIRLPALKDKDREQIWDSSFGKLAEERNDVVVTHELVRYAYYSKDILELRWNGREIKNSFNTMIALAEWDAKMNKSYTTKGKVEVRKEHLQKAVDVSKNFRGYHEKLRQMGSTEYINGLGIRHDESSDHEERE